MGFDSSDKMESIITKLLEFGASPTDKIDSDMMLSPLEVIVMRRDPNMLRLMLDNLKSPLEEGEIARINRLLEAMNYNLLSRTINKLASPSTLPEEAEWHANLEEMKTIVSEKLGNLPNAYSRTV